MRVTGERYSEAAERGKGEVARLVALVVPVVVVRHLRERQPALCLVCEVEVARDAAVLLQ